jgi:hypothetical protein
MSKDGGRLRVIEHSGAAIDLSRSDTGDVVLRLGTRYAGGPERTIPLNASEAKALAYSLLAAAERTSFFPEPSADCEWPEEHWSEGTFPLPDRT